jgi:hypothetical protein
MVYRFTLKYVAPSKGTSIIRETINEPKMKEEKTSDNLPSFYRVLKNKPQFIVYEKFFYITPFIAKYAKIDNSYKSVVIAL